MRFELTTSTLAIFLQPTTPFGKFSNINHNVSRAKWKIDRIQELSTWQTTPLKYRRSLTRERQGF
jgi:hypothetical protein